MISNIRKIANFSILFFLLLIFIIYSLSIGKVALSIGDFADVFLGHEIDRNKFLLIKEIRLPRVLAAVLSGISLSVAGMQMQTVFRNPLAGPYVLGISSGASLGVAIAILAFGSFLSTVFFSFWGAWVLIGAAFSGALFVTVLLFIVSFKVREIMTLLILGVLLGGGVSAIVAVLQYLSPEPMLKNYVIWTMGNFKGISLSEIYIYSICVFIGLIICFFSIKNLNLLLLGEEYAKTMGLNVYVSRLFILASVCLLAGATTAFCGPIGFVGIAVPHISRLIFATANHRVVFGANVICGALLMVICDIISMLPGADITLPLNSISSIIGIPIVIWLIVKKKKIF